MKIANSTALGGAIYQRRTDLGLTQAELAQRANVSRQWLVAVERGKNTAEVGRVLAVIRVLGLQLALTPTTSNDLDVIVDG
ncbi:MAG: helix-turn-helix domain-containing protein [Ilumatobacteraceae bacterium]